MTGMNGASPPRFGEFAPSFSGDLDIKDGFNFNAVGGRWVVMQFMMRADVPLSIAAHQTILDASDLFDDVDASYFGISINPADFKNNLKSRIPGRRYYKDFDEAITKLYGLKIPGGYMPVTLLLDRNLRVVAIEPLRNTARILDILRNCLAEERPVLQDSLAPVLTVPRVFEPEFCRALIDYYERQGGEVSGFMRQIGDKTVGIHDPKFKRRKDATIHDETLRAGAVDRIYRRLLPVIERAYNWRGTRIERYIVACYSAEDAGFFNAHRDNTTSGTAHRQFAVSINLNAEEFEGGELRFPEFGPRTYKPPTGGATVFGCGLLHEATPVTKGVRYAFLPFLYDEEAKLIRQQNAASVVAYKAEQNTKEEEVAKTAGESA